MDKKYLREVSFYDEAQTMGLEPDEAYVYSYLSLNAHINFTGLYRIQRRHIRFDLGVSLDRLDGILGRLAQLHAIVYDNELLFVPRIPDEQNFLTRKGWDTTLKKVRSKHAAILSELPGAANKAYAAFMAFHAETLSILDGEEADDDDSEGAPEHADQGAPGTQTDPFEAASTIAANGSPSLATVAQNGQSLPIEAHHDPAEGHHNGSIPARGHPTIHLVDGTR